MKHLGRNLASYMLLMALALAWCYLAYHPNTLADLQDWFRVAIPGR